MKQELSQRTTVQQQLAMTPQLAEAIAILAMPVTELAIWTRTQLESNPILEEETEALPIEPAPTTAGAEESDEALERDLHEEDRRALEELEKWDWAEYFDSVAEGESPELTEPAEEDYYSQVPQNPPNLAESLWSQLNLRTSDPEVLAIGYELIGALDEAGYLAESLQNIAQRYGKPLSLLEKILTEYIQTLEPAGVGARDLTECLHIQLADRNIPSHDLAYQILDHLPLVLQKGKLAKILKVEPQALEKSISLIQSLDPKPGLAVGITPNQDIIPEVTVRLIEGKPVITMEQWNVPMLKISPRYREMIEHPVNLTAETRRYLGRMYGRAIWIIRAVEKRRQTILEVAQKVFGKQKEFLEDGTGALSPLTMQQVADSIGINVSTVSRVVANKYVETPFGIFPFRHFFTSSLPTVKGIRISSDGVQKKIRNYISSEDPNHPLSDEALVKSLTKEGIKVARRTITKYRNQMGIADTTRRRMK